MDVPLKNPDAPGIPVEFLDFTYQKDNSSYVPDLTQGVLQLCEILNDEDMFLQNIDIEKLIQESQMLMGTAPATAQLTKDK